jgi:ADP-heptose:LPS heptosyltransferase/SAM-dependent methyltransferase
MSLAHPDSRDHESDIKTSRTVAGSAPAPSRDPTARLRGLRHRRLLELENEKLLTEYRAARAHIEREEHAQRAWRESRTFNLLTRIARMTRGSPRDRLRAGAELCGLLLRGSTSTLLRRARLRRPPPAIAPSELDYPDHGWEAWKRLCLDHPLYPDLRLVRPNPGNGPLRIAVVGSGGLGDALHAVTAAAAIKQMMTPCRITLVHNFKGVKGVTAGNGSIEQTLLVPPDHHRVRGALTHTPAFDLVVDALYCIRYMLPPQSRVGDSFPDDRILAASLQARPFLRYMDEFPLRNNQFGRALRRMGMNLMDIMGLSGGLPIDSRTPIPFSPDPDSFDAVLDLFHTPYITIHNGIGENTGLNVDPAVQRERGYDSTKQLPLATWAAVTKEMIQHGYAVVQVGHKAEVAIPGVTHDLRGLTAMSDVALLIKHARCHIDTEGGLAHLARAVNRPAVVLFGPTPADLFGYPQHINMEPATCSDCWWVTSSWVIHCPLDTKGPVCMLDHRPGDIVASVLRSISTRQDSRCTLVGAALFSQAEAAALKTERDAILRICDLPPAEAGETLHNPDRGLLMLPPRCWEYPYVLRAIRRAFATPIGRLRIAVVGDGRSAFAYALGRMGAEVVVFDSGFRQPVAQGDPADAEDQFLLTFRDAGEVRFGSIFNLPANGDSFDAVVCFDTFGTLRHHGPALAELLRITRPDGQVILGFALHTDAPDGAPDSLDPPALEAVLNTRQIDMPFDAASIADSVRQCQQAGLVTTGTRTVLTLRKQPPAADPSVIELPTAARTPH